MKDATVEAREHFTNALQRWSNFSREIRNADNPHARHLIDREAAELADALAGAVINLARVALIGGAVDVEGSLYRVRSELVAIIEQHQVETRRLLAASPPWRLSLAWFLAGGRERYEARQVARLRNALPFFRPRDDA